MESFIKITNASKPEWHNGSADFWPTTDPNCKGKIIVKKHGFFFNKKDKTYDIVNDIKQCKMVSDSDQVVAQKKMGGTLAGAAVGGLLTGGFGAIVGGMASGNSHKNVRTAEFAVEFNDGEFLVLSLYNKGDMTGKILNVTFNQFVKNVQKHTVGINPFAEA